MWILVASALVPMPLIQGWVMFVSVFCFVATTVLLILYIIGAHGGEASWVTLVSASSSCLGVSSVGPHPLGGCPGDIPRPSWPGLQL